VSDSNRTQIGIIEETTFNTTPNNPAFQTLRTTGHPNFGYNPLTRVSNEIRSDRQIPDMIFVGSESGGDINFELSVQALDTILEGALFNDWIVNATLVNAGSGDVIETVTEADDTYTVASGGASFPANGLIYASGFTESTNNGLKEVVSSTETTIVIDNGCSDETPPAGARIRLVGLQGESGDITAHFGVKTFEIRSTLLDFTDFPIAAGDWIKIGGTAPGTYFDTAAINGWAKVASVSATEIALSVAPTSSIVDTGTGKTIQIFFGDKITNGTTKKSYSIERQYLDHSPPTYEVFTGMTVNTFQFQAQPQEIMTASASFMGKEAAASTSRISGATSLPTTTNDLLNTSSHVGRIAEAGAAVGSPNYVIEASIQINNNLRRVNAIGEVGAIAINAGRCNVSGNLNTYFGDLTLYNKLLNNTATSYDLRVGRDNKHVIIDLPRIKFSSGSPEVSGPDTDIPLNLGFQAMRDPTLGYTIKVQQFHYVP